MPINFNVLKYFTETKKKDKQDFSIHISGRILVC